MSEDRFQIDDIEEGDVVWVDNTNGWCMVKEIHLGLRNGYIVVFEHTGLWGIGNPGKEYSKHYTNRKTFKMYE